MEAAAIRLLIHPIAPGGPTVRSPWETPTVYLPTYLKCNDIFRSAIDPRGGSRPRILTYLPGSLATCRGRLVFNRSQAEESSAQSTLPLNRRGGLLPQGSFFHTAFPVGAERLHFAYLRNHYCPQSRNIL